MTRMARKIIDLVEGNLGALLLLEDGVEALDAPFDAGLDVVLAQLLNQRVFHAAQELLALSAAGFNGCRNLFVTDGVNIAEGQILQLAAHLSHAQPMSQGSVDVHGLAGNGQLALRLQIFQGAHVVQPVGQLDQHHAHIRNHGQQHLAHVFGLAVLAIGELDLVYIGDALDNVGHLLAEVGHNLVMVAGVSSTESCSRPAAMAVESIFISASTSATSSG
jgi:hypothetical protein